MDQDGYTPSIPQETSPYSSAEVVGYPAPADIVTFDAAQGAKRASIKVKLETLLDRGPDGFGDRAIQKIANALETVADAVSDIEPPLESSGLPEIAEKLENFAISDGDARGKRTTWEWMKGRKPPLAQLLDRLEDLAEALPPYQDIQALRWKELKSAYKRVHTVSGEVGDFAAAGREHLARANAELRPAHEQTLEILPENRGQETEAALLALRAARDQTERRVHSLRGDHGRGQEVLLAVRGLARSYAEAKQLRTHIDNRSIPQWENQVANLIRAENSGSDYDAPIDLSALRGSNSQLAEQFRQAIAAAENFAQAHVIASAATDAARPDPAS